MFMRISKVDDVVVLLNLALAMAASFFPFTVSVVCVTILQYQFVDYLLKYNFCFKLNRVVEQDSFLQIIN